MTFALGTFVCKDCKEVTHYNFNQRISEEEWDQFRDLGMPSSTTSIEMNSSLFESPEKILDQSFVFIQSTYDKAQNAIKPEENSNNSSRRGSQNSNHSNAGIVDISLLKANTSIKNDFSHSVQVLDQILKISAGHAQVQHPLCEDCTSKIIKNLESKLEDLNSEGQTYTDYISQWSKSKENPNPNMVNTRQRNRQNTSIDEGSKLKSYEMEICQLQSQLKQLQIEKKRHNLELAQLEKEALRMNKYEELFFCDANDFWYSIENLSMQHSCIRQKIREVSSHLRTMKQTNVFDDAFHIYYDGHFGTINGLRLGRLPSVIVDWEEINTGLGQCVLLLDVLAQRCKCKSFKFNGYELYPMGSASYIKERPMRNANGHKNSVEKSVTHQMFISSQGFWKNKKCDKALECFLQCMKQFADWMHMQDNNFHLRYDIQEGGYIGDSNTNKFLKIGFSLNTEENWTQALKYMVIDLKYLLAWVARFSP